MQAASHHWDPRTIQPHLLPPTKNKIPVETFSISPACSSWCSVPLHSGGCFSRLTMGTESCWGSLRVWDLSQATSSSCRNQEVPVGPSPWSQQGSEHAGMSNVSVEPLNFPLLRRLGLNANPSWQEGDPAFHERMLEVTSVQSEARSCNEPEQGPAPPRSSSWKRPGLQ